jgi:glutathione S-transferase
MTTPFRLMTIGPSHYCEKARWALDFFGVPYDEEPHPPIVHWGWSLRSGGGRTVPILFAGERVIGDSTDILHFLDERHGNGCRLYPTDPELRSEVNELEELFDTRLGPHTRRLAYFHLLPQRSLALAAIMPGVSSGQGFIFRVGFPFFRWFMRRGMNINPASAERSLDRVRQVFAIVDERLDDGRDFLVGGAFTAADLTFAALAAPVLVPPQYGTALPMLEELPEAIAELVEEFRMRPAGRFGLRLYRDRR